MNQDAFVVLFLALAIVAVPAYYMYLNVTDPIPYDDSKDEERRVENEVEKAKGLCKTLGIEYRIEELNQNPKVALERFWELAQGKYLELGRSFAEGQNKYLEGQEQILFKAQEELQRLRSIDNSAVKAQNPSPQVIEPERKEVKKEIKKGASKEDKEIGNIMSDDDFL